MHIHDYIMTKIFIIMLIFNSIKKSRVGVKYTRPNTITGMPDFQGSPKSWMSKTNTGHTNTPTRNTLKLWISKFVYEYDPKLWWKSSAYSLVCYSTLLNNPHGLSSLNKKRNTYFLWPSCLLCLHKLPLTA